MYGSTFEAHHSDICMIQFEAQLITQVCRFLVKTYISICNILSAFICKLENPKMERKNGEF